MTQKTLTVYEAEKLYRKKAKTIARKLQRAGIRPAYTTAQNRGVPKRHYWQDDIERALVDRRHHPHTWKRTPPPYTERGPHAETTTPPLSA